MARIFLRALAICYFAGFVLHLLDLLGQRLDFFQLGTIWQAWILYLLVADLVAAVGLWLERSWGVALFVVIALSQLVAYIGFASYFGPQPFLIGFHLATLAIYFAIRKIPSSPRPQ